MWQFMAGTARGTGLRVDWWVDERRDPVRSTDAAVKFLGWLQRAKNEDPPPAPTKQEVLLTEIRDLLAAKNQAMAAK